MHHGPHVPHDTTTEDHPHSPLSAALNIRLNKRPPLDDDNLHFLCPELTYYSYI